MNIGKANKARLMPQALFAYLIEAFGERQVMYVQADNM